MRNLLALVLGVFAVTVPTHGLSPRVCHDARAVPAIDAGQDESWILPRTPDGKPDLQGNWTNETQTPLERMGTSAATLTPDQAAAIDNLERLPGHVRPWFGDSIGRWDGDTLVVETTNIHPLQLSQTSILWPYCGASEKLKIIERFTRTGPETLLYRFTMEDPSTFSAPFTGELPFHRIDEMIHEYACHEGNYALSNILSGARAHEKRQAEQKKQP